jgi:DeoR/GlpR family transcriptional regulator of sugar metabolism
LRAGETIAVIWTISTPQDDDIPGKAARRHHRLRRLLGEAYEQGAAPSIEHLAQALGVDRRTIQRDLKALREQNLHLPPARGKMSQRST